MTDVSDLAERLERAGYIADATLATTLDLVALLRRPLLVEGDAGVGKTALAKALAHAFETNLIRLQCYEGLDAQSAVYEWNYAHQLLAIKQGEALAAFGERAALVTRALGRRDYRIVSLDVSTGGGVPPPRLMGTATVTMQAGKVAPPALEGGAQTVTVTVSGTIEVGLVSE